MYYFPNFMWAGGVFSVLLFNFFFFFTEEKKKLKKLIISHRLFSENVLKS